MNQAKKVRLLPVCVVIFSLEFQTRTRVGQIFFICSSRLWFVAVLAVVVPLLVLADDNAQKGRLYWPI